MPIPSSLPWMESVDAKMGRANEHLFSLTNEIQKWLSEQKRNFALKVNPHTGAQWIVYWTDDDIPPVFLSAILGDIMFNLRSVLDHLVCGMVRTREPAAPCERLQFPVFTERDKWDTAATRAMLKGVPPPAVKVIESLQPYRRGELNAALDPLNILTILNNWDKHRAIHLTSTFSRNTYLSISEAATGREVCKMALREPLRSGDTADVPTPKPLSGRRDETANWAPQGHNRITRRSAAGAKAYAFGVASEFSSKFAETSEPRRNQTSNPQEESRRKNKDAKELSGSHGGGRRQAAAHRCNL